MQLKILLILFSIILLISCDTKEQINLNINDNPATLELFGKGIISTNLYERDIAISPDGNEIIYTIGDYNQLKRGLVSLKKIENSWNSPSFLQISGVYQDIEPFITVDGQKLFFASNRPIYNDSTRTDYNIWFSSKKAGEWTEPIPLDSTINTPGNEFYPSVSQNGNLYFTAIYTYGKGLEDIFVSKFINGKYTIPESLDSMINTKYYEFNAYISPAEDVLIFSSFGRKDEFGGGDLYMSKKNSDGKWSRAKNLGNKINSEKLDYCPFIDWERNNFYFTSERIKTDSEKMSEIKDIVKYANQVNNGFGNIYRIGLQSLQKE